MMGWIRNLFGKRNEEGLTNPDIKEPEPETTIAVSSGFADRGAYHGMKAQRSKQSGPRIKGAFGRMRSHDRHTRT